MALDCLTTDGVGFIDYIDFLLHPPHSIELVRMFKNRRLNTEGHSWCSLPNSTELLSDELFRASKIGIVSKTLKKALL